MKYIKFYTDNSKTGHIRLDGRYRVSHCIEKAISFATRVSATVTCFEIREGGSYEKSKPVTSKLSIKEAKDFFRKNMPFMQ